MNCKYSYEDIVKFSEGIFSQEVQEEIKKHITLCKKCNQIYSLLSFTDDYLSQDLSFSTTVVDKSVGVIDKDRYAKRKLAISIFAIAFKIKPFLKPVLALAIFSFLLIGLYRFYIQHEIISDNVPLTTDTGDAINESQKTLHTDSIKQIVTVDLISDELIEDLINNPHFPTDEYLFEKLDAKGYIDKATAAKEALKFNGTDRDDYPEAVKAVLVKLTKKKYAQIAGSSVVLKDYPVWVVSLYGINITVHSKPVFNTAKEKNEAKVIQGNTHILVDASTGEVLQSIGYAISAERTAIKLALEEHPETDFPEIPGKVQGEFFAGGKAPGMRIPAQLETRLQIDESGNYIVTLTQYWSAEYLRGKNSEGSILYYFWKYRVNGDSIVLIEEGGDNTFLIMK